jgi:transcriptional regulator with XRE-family HTH domain
VATEAGIARGYLAAIEAGRANPSVEVVEAIVRALGVEAHLALRGPITIERHQRDLVHARCIAAIERRLRAGGWHTKHEAEVVLGRSHGWIDVLAFHPGSECLLVVEVKTRIDNIGAAERQIGWYSRAAFEPARRLGWRPRRIATWLLVAATTEADRALMANRELLLTAFPMRASAMLAWLAAGVHPLGPRGLALVDPRSKRRDWLIRARIDGRRSAARYADYDDLAKALGP